MGGVALIGDWTTDSEESSRDRRQQDVKQDVKWWPSTAGCQVVANLSRPKRECEYRVDARPTTVSLRSSQYPTIFNTD